MTRWQRRARLVLGVVFVGVIAAVFILMRQRAPQAPPPDFERLDAREVSRTRGGDVIQLKGDRRDGRTFVIAGQEAWIGAERTSYDIRGGVALRTSDGLVATTDQATFTEMEG